MWSEDIKPSNLLLDDGDLRITDFGWCCDVSESPRALAGLPLTLNTFTLLIYIFI